jgi:hypothetical protein
MIISSLALQPLPEHVTKELILTIAQENADMTIRVIRETSAKQKSEGLSDEQAAEMAEYVIIASFCPRHARLD